MSLARLLGVPALACALAVAPAAAADAGTNGTRTTASAKKTKKKRTTRKAGRSPARATPARPAPASAPAPSTPQGAPSAGGALASAAGGATAAVTAAAEWPLRAPSTAIEPRVFGGSSFWETRLSATQAADPASSGLVGDLVRQVREHGPWINTTRYTAPVYTVGADQPRVPVVLDAHTPSLKAAFAAGVPLPSNATGSAGTDGTAVVWQPSTNTYWELWQLRKLADGWHARWGGVLRDASGSEGVFAPGFGTAASGLALAGGMIRPGEFRNWSIDHVMRIGLPEVTAGAIRAPANRTDGRAAGGIPMGTRFQLDPALDVWALDVPLATKIIAHAAQRYGMVVGDSSGAVTLYAEDPATMTTDPWPALLGGQSPSQVMSRFPWERMRALPALSS